MREHGRGHEGRVLDLDLVVDLVLLLEAPEDGDGVLHRRLLDHDGLEAALEGGVLFDVLAVLVEGGGAHAAELAARQGRLEDIRRVHRAFRPAPAPSAAPAPTRVCSSSMKQMISPSLSVISRRTALRRSSNSPRYLEPATMAPMSMASRRLPLSPSGTSPATMRWARPSTMAVLPTPGSPMRTGLFLVRRESNRMTLRISSSRP